MKANEVLLIATSALIEARSRAIKEAKSAGLTDEQAAVVSDTVDKMIYQDKARTSWRIWGGFWAAVTGVLLIPEVQAAIHVVIGALLPEKLLPIVTAGLGAIWPVISKSRDLRPKKG